jgi:hypothetical protein
MAGVPTILPGLSNCYVTPGEEVSPFDYNLSTWLQSCDQLWRPRVIRTPSNDRPVLSLWHQLMA